MGKTVIEPMMDQKVKDSFRESAILKASEIIQQHGVHHGLGIKQQKVDWLRRKDELDIKSALFVLYHAGELELK